MELTAETVQILRAIAEVYPLEVLDLHLTQEVDGVAVMLPITAEDLEENDI
jgi:hypothetical protein